MWRNITFLAWRDVRHSLREKETVLWLVFMPIVFFWFIGTVTSGFGGSSQEGKDKIAVEAPADIGLLGERLLAKLTARDYEIDAAAERRLTLPDGLTERVRRGDKVTVRLARDGSSARADYDTLRIGAAVYATLAELVACTRDGGEPTVEALAALDAAPRTLTIRSTSAGERQRIPTGFEQTIPGILVMFTLLVLATSGAILLVIERNQGLLRRLAATPIPRHHVVAGKWCGKMALGVVQIGVAMLTGTLLFSMRWGPALPMVMVVLLAWGALCASLGLLLGSVARTEGQAIGVGVLAANVLAALGGCWWPIEITPSWMQAVQKCLPTGWAMDAMHRLISFGQPASAALPHVAALVVGAAVIGAVAVRRFRFV